MPRTIPFVVGAIALVFADLVAQGGTPTGQFFVRERANGDHSVLAEVESSEPVTRVEFTPPDRATFIFPAFLSKGWTATLDGRKIVATGEGTSRFNIRLDARSNQNLLKNFPGKDVEFTVGFANGRTARIKVKCTPLPRVGSMETWQLEKGLTLPPEITLGSSIFFTASPGFTKGAWLPGDQDEAALKNAVDQVRDAASRTHVTNQLRELALRDFGNRPGLTIPGTDTLFYVDEYGERIGAMKPAWTSVPPASCDAGISGGTPQAIAGQDACLRGCFGARLSELDMAAKFLMDDTVPVTPQAASPTTVVIRIPADTTPGLHNFSWTGVPNRVEIRILRVEGTIDTTKLWKGDSTTMRLRVLGSDQPVKLSIVNRTPTIIQVEGGAEQLIPTSGGTENVVTRQVRGILKGNFTIDFSVDQPPCGAPR